MVSAIAIAIGALITAGLIPSASRELIELIQAAASGTHLGFDAALLMVKDKISRIFLVIILPIVCSMALVALFATLLMTKFMVAFESLKPNFAKFNPVSGAKNIFSLDKLYDVINNLLFFIYISLLLYTIISSNTRNAVYSVFCGVNCINEIFSNAIILLVAAAVAYLLVVSGFDFIIQNALFKRKQKMTKDEVKREHKESEGDPHIKSQRKQIARDIVETPGFKDITHVVASQTVAVAFRYDKTDCPNPFVILKVKGDAALSLKRKVLRMGKQVVNLPAVADSLYKATTAGDEAPTNSYDEIREVIKKGQAEES